VVRAELPGVDKDDVVVRLLLNYLLERIERLDARLRARGA
jgi:HSP20 family molecular chaperone IbpA